MEVRRISKAGRGDYALIMTGQCPDNQVELDQSILEDEGANFYLGTDHRDYGLEGLGEPEDLYEDRRRLDPETERDFDDMLR